MTGLFQDVRYAVRRLRRTPLFSVFAAVILAVGIGLNVAVFGVVDAILLRQAPFADRDSIVHIYQDSDAGSPSSTAYPAYREIAALTDLFDSVAATTSAGVNWDGPDGPRQLAVDFATASYFQVLGVAPQLGRWFDAEHDTVGAERVAVVTDRTWRTRFGADPGVVGRTVRLNNQPVTIIGIGPKGFNGEAGAVATDLWLSISSVAVAGEFRVANLEARESHWYTVKARLKSGVAVEQARGALASLAARHGELYPDLDKGRDITLFTYDQVRMHPAMDAALTGGGLGMFVVAAVVLLLACSNLANLLLLRGLARGPELAVREALGGERARVARPLLVEALLLAAVGGAGGLAAAAWAQRILATLSLPGVGGVLDIRFDYRMVLFSVLAALATGLLFGWLPARRSAAAGVATVLRDAGRSPSAGRGSSLLRGALVAVQMALSLVLVAATGLLARSLANTTEVDPGFDVERIAVIATNLAQAGVPQEENGVVGEQILARLGALPGVERVALTSRLPLSRGPTASTVLEGYEPPEGTNAVDLDFAIVSRDYFETMGIGLRSGRAFSGADRPDSPPVVIVNETAARLFFGDNAVGRRARGQNQPDAWREVVGVVADVKVTGLQEPATPMLYFPQEQFGAGAFSLVVRAQRDPAVLLPALPRALRDVRESLPVTRVEPIAAQVASALVAARTSALLMGAFAGLALVLAALGIYAAVSFAVERRTHEIGVRIALGATKPRLIGMVVGGSIKLAALGITAGLVLATLGARGMQSLLFGVAPFDVLSFGGAALVLLVAAGLAALVPALRAARAAPAAVLSSR